MESGHSVPSDAASLARILFDAVDEIARGDFSEEQVKAWAPVIPTPERFLERGNSGRLVLVAVDDSDEPVAYGSCGTVASRFCP